MPGASQFNPTIFVVEDNAEMRASLVELLDVSGLAVRTFPSAGSFARYYKAEMPGCLIADIRMPGQAGLELYKQLLRERNRLPVIFITAHADVPTAVAAMKAGAMDFLEKPLDHELLLDRVHVALALDSHWRRREAEFAAIAERVDRLSDRERETLALVIAGESNKSAAEKLFLTERAVEMRRSSIMKKLEVKSLAELLGVAIRHRILNELHQSDLAIGATLKRASVNNGPAALDD
jgi:FixJ family two-component response regulator